MQEGYNILVRRYFQGDAIDQPLAFYDYTQSDQYGGSQRIAWTLADHLGSVRGMTNSYGTTLKNTLTYDGWGNVLTESDSGWGDRYKWTGREFDAETGLQYNRARYYDPKLGKWISEDPVGFDAGDSNLYRYVHNQPTRWKDPSGLRPVEETWWEEDYYFEGSFSWEDGAFEDGALDDWCSCGSVGETDIWNSEGPNDPMEQQKGDIAINIYVGSPNPKALEAMTKLQGETYYGAAIPVIYEITGLQPKTYAFQRTKKEVTKDKNGVDINDKAAGPDGPNQNAPYTQFRKANDGTITYINIDIPTFAVAKRLLPAEKTVEYVFTLYDKLGGTQIAQQRITMTWKIDENGKTTVTPPANATITFSEKGAVEYIKKDSDQCCPQLL